MKILHIIMIAGGTVLLLVTYHIKWSPSAKRASRNAVLSKKIEIGMTRAKVIEIMGAADEEYLEYGDTTVTILFYQPPFGASAGIEFYVGGDGKVQRITPYEPT